MTHRRNQREVRKLAKRLAMEFRTELWPNVLLCVVVPLALFLIGYGYLGAL